MNRLTHKQAKAIIGNGLLLASVASFLMLRVEMVELSPKDALTGVSVLVWTILAVVSGSMGTWTLATKKLPSFYLGGAFLLCGLPLLLALVWTSQSAMLMLIGKYSVIAGIGVGLSVLIYHSVEFLHRNDPAV